MLVKTKRAIQNEQSRGTGYVGYTRQMTNTNKKKTKKTQKTKKMSNTDPTKNQCLQNYTESGYLLNFRTNQVYNIEILPI